MKHISQLQHSELVQIRFFELIKIRLPWILVGLGGALITSVIISRFELSLRENVALAFFIPIIAYVSDEIGTQTETILIRALANLKFDKPKYILREFKVGLLMGSVFGLMAGVFAYILSGSYAVSLVVAIALFISMSLATVLACMTPLVLKAMGKDPAVGSGPFTTALQDLVSLTIYFLVAFIIL
jgi:magnesium transporter